MNLSEEEKNVLSTLERIEANEEAERYYHFIEGKAEGIAEVAKSMLKDGMPLETVVKYTNQTLTYVTELKAELDRQ